MSSDFLVNTSDKINPKFVLQAKYESAFQDVRTIEKLELERRYWIKKNIPWMLITEKDIPKVVFQNISWMYPAQRDELESHTILERIDFYTHHFYKSPDDSLIAVAKKLDIVVKLFVLAQLRAIATRMERLTSKLLRQVYKDEFKPVHPMLDALRSGDEERIFLNTKTSINPFIYRIMQEFFRESLQDLGYSKSKLPELYSLVAYLHLQILWVECEDIGKNKDRKILRKAR